MMCADRNSASIRKSLWNEAVIALRFAVVGLVATIIHLGAVALLIMTTSLPILIANTLAFSIGFFCSFLGNYLWTFRTPGSPMRAMGRFLTIATFAYAMNMVLLAWLIQQSWTTDMYAAIGAVIIVPVITFFGSRLWGFQPSIEPGEQHK